VIFNLRIGDKKSLLARGLWGDGKEGIRDRNAEKGNQEGIREKYQTPIKSAINLQHSQERGLQKSKKKERNEKREMKLKKRWKEKNNLPPTAYYGTEEGV